VLALDDLALRADRLDLSAALALRNLLANLVEGDVALVEGDDLVDVGSRTGAVLRAFLGTLLNLLGNAIVELVTRAESAGHGHAGRFHPRSKIVRHLTFVIPAFK